MFARDQLSRQSPGLGTGNHISRLFAGATIVASILGIVYVTQAALSAVMPKPPTPILTPADAAAMDAAAFVATSPPAAQTPSAPERFSKAEFASYAYGLTKAEVRRQFGRPLMVHERDDSWFYPSLPIYDVDAGIQVSVTIQFTGIGGPDDEVADVRY